MSGEFQLKVNNEGVVDQASLAELRCRLTDDLKAKMLGLFPEEFFQAQVRKAFEALTERRSVYATGDDRCAACRSGFEKKARCLHVKVDAPSEIQEMFQTEMKAHIQKRVEKFARDWAEGGIKDLDVALALEGFEDNVAKIQEDRKRQDLVSLIAATLRSQLLTCSGWINNGTCGAIVTAGVPSQVCGQTN